ncbi:peroxidase 73-like [Panicum virgatum]|uniref:peroxidase 73-like n=1 Tax=Panicum virgatum TaxID=38727 RepID=UPI0019D51C10|nr:peroxidase 73-like [Panicum virgatum]
MQKPMEKRIRRCGNLLVVVALALVSAMLPPSGEAKLSPDYYWSTCLDVEAIVRAVVAKKVKETFVTVPATLRLFFHDCFVEVSHIHQCLQLLVRAINQKDPSETEPDSCQNLAF